MLPAGRLELSSDASDQFDTIHSALTWPHPLLSLGIHDRIFTGLGVAIVIDPYNQAVAESKVHGDANGAAGCFANRAVFHPSRDDRV